MSPAHAEGTAQPGRCAVHQDHGDAVPLVIVEHHIQPLGMGGPDVPKNKIATCDNGHRAIHTLMGPLANGRPMPDGGTPTERLLAQRGVDLWIAAGRPGSAHAAYGHAGHFEPAHQAASGGTTYTGQLTGPDGTTMTVTATLPPPVAPTPTPQPTPTPAPSPTPDPVPAGANTIRIGGPGGATFPLAAVNPTPQSNPAGAAYPGCRGPNQLILDRAPWTATGTNGYGTEVVITAAGTVGTATSSRPGGIAVPPAPGFVLSGHGAAEAWLKANAKAGARVEVLAAVPPPSPGPAPSPAPTPAPSPASARTVAMYLKRGAVGSTQLRAAMAAGVNQARTAFLQGSPLQLVDWGGEPVSSLASALADLRARGGTALSSVGGQGGGVPSSASVYVDGIRAARTTVGPDGWDVDVEASGLNVATIVQAAVTLAKDTSARWITSFVPPGGPPVAVFLDAAAQCAAAGLEVQFGQQLYSAGSKITVSQALAQTQLAVSKLGDPRRVLIGMWCGPNVDQWTLAECEQVLAAALQEWPTLGGAYCWTEDGSEVPAWAKAMSGLLAG